MNAPLVQPHSLRRKVLNLLLPIHTRLRKQKLDLFFELAGDCAQQSLLDLGGHSSAGMAGEFLPLYQAFRNVTVVNISARRLQFPTTARIRRVAADACSLPFASQSFDWVFSNAVIEHVGNWEAQKRFAAEVRRVARRGYYVTTPNKRFPIEPHTYLPIYQYMPAVVQRRMIVFATGWVNTYEHASHIRLLTMKQMRELFPHAQVCRTGFPLYGNSLVAAYRALPGSAELSEAA